MRYCPSSVGLCLAFSLFACATPAGAHEIGTTRVSVLLQEGRRYDIEIVTDAPSLVAKLDAVAGAQSRALSTAASSPEALVEGLLAHDAIFRQRVAVTFDGAAGHPTIRYAVTPAPDAMAPIFATIRLTGEIPRGARHFAWLYSWTFASYALTITSSSGGIPVTEWLEGGDQSTPFVMTAPPRHADRLAIARQYLVLGFTHIVPHGLDHMLFVIGLFLLSGCLRTVLWQVSAFTVAHSITLGLSMYGVLTAPPGIVEPLIAISIAYVAIENVFLKELKPWRVALVFGFGLLHGMGFAGALKELGLPPSEFLTALLTFNVGVEGGQLAVIAAAFALVGWQWGNQTSYRRHVVVPASVLIACTAVYWTVERVAF